jgi:pimeloyl-ACP methyl ester carboxylesterase
MAEVLVKANDVEICTESFGDPGDRAVLLVMGAASSMLRWEDELCRQLAARGRHVVRFDNRDTGRSTTVAPGTSTYTMLDMADDAVGVLEALSIETAHVVGISMGGQIAQNIALRHPQRVTGLTLVATTCDPHAALRAAAGEALKDDLPGATDAFMAAAASATVTDPADPAFVEEQLDLYRVLCGPGRAFDEATQRDLISRELTRAVDLLSSYNHGAAIAATPRWRGELGRIAVPTVVLHGSGDPLMPLAHGAALAAEVPGAKLVVLEGAGHEINREDWPVLIDAITAGEPAPS